MKKQNYLLLLGMVICVTACQTNNALPEQAAADVSPKAKQEVALAEPIYINDKETDEKQETVRVIARGYGSPPKKYYPVGQRKLMAMRAARLDAYRSLAEQINGLHIWGGTTIGDMVVEKDQFQVFLEAFVMGAKVLDVEAKDDEIYEAVVEAVIDQDFLQKIMAQRSEAIKAAVIPVSSAQDVSKEQTTEMNFDENIQPNFYFSDTY
jgi:hypothetical protein